MKNGGQNELSMSALTHTSSTNTTASALAASPSYTLAVLLHYSTKPTLIHIHLTNYTRHNAIMLIFVIVFPVCHQRVVVPTGPHT